jgi:hypothetical protein
MISLSRNTFPVGNFSSAQVVVICGGILWREEKVAATYLLLPSVALLLGVPEQILEIQMFLLRYFYIEFDVAQSRE